MMGVNAFNQPNVQKSKEEIVSVLNEYLTFGKSPDLGAEGSFQRLMQMSSGGEYLAIMVYLEQTPELDRTLDVFRKNIQHGSNQDWPNDTTHKSQKRLQGHR